MGSTSRRDCHVPSQKMTSRIGPRLMLAYDATEPATLAGGDDGRGGGATKVTPLLGPVTAAVASSATVDILLLAVTLRGVAGNPSDLADPAFDGARSDARDSTDDAVDCALSARDRAGSGSTLARADLTEPAFEGGLAGVEEVFERTEGAGDGADLLTCGRASASTTVDDMGLGSGAGDGGAGAGAG